jgi:hypothetical protein
MGGACGTYEKHRNANRFLVGKPERKRQTGRPKRRYEDNIKMGVKEIGCEYMELTVWVRIGTSGGVLRTR